MANYPSNFWVQLFLTSSNHHADAPKISIRNIHNNLGNIEKKEISTDSTKAFIKDSIKGLNWSSKLKYNPNYSTVCYLAQKTSDWMMKIPGRKKKTKNHKHLLVFQYELWSMTCIRYKWISLSKNFIQYAKS